MAAALAPHQSRPARDAARALERGGPAAGQGRVQEGARAEGQDSARGVVQLSSLPVETVLRDHMRAVGDLLIRERGSGVDMLEGDRDRWVRSSDGIFRPEKPRHPNLEWFRYKDRSDHLPTFAPLVEAIRADPILNPQLEAMIGAGGGATRFDVDRLVLVMLRALIDTDRAALEFREDRFKSRWEAIARDLYADTLNGVTVVLLPGLTVPGGLPVDLAPSFEITTLTDSEVTRSVDSGLLVPWLTPLIRDSEAGAVRHTRRLPKEINATLDLSIDEGTFGQRPLLSTYLLADDVLLVFRLLRAGRLRSPGVIQYIDSWLLEGNINFYHRATRSSDRGEFALAASDIHELRAVWTALTSSPRQAKRFVAASARRFNMASDRYSIEDSLVDLMIASESLFLSDAAAPADRGELGFRLAQRAALFVDWSEYSRREIFDLVTTAYRLRNTIVHGERLGGKEVQLPRQGAVSISVFRDAVEELMRRAIRKALNEVATVRNFGDREYWLARLFPSATPLT